MLSWLTNFLSDRKQIFRFSNTFSSQVKVTSGVPRRSHLDLLFLVLFIDDTSNVFRHSNYRLLYTNDPKIFLSLDNPRLVQLIRCEFDGLHERCLLSNLSSYLTGRRVVEFSRNKNSHIRYKRCSFIRFEPCQEPRHHLRV